MAHREFRDAAGVRWEVWDVVPGAVTGTPLVAPREDLAEGWLVFRSATERRRLFQRPLGWERYNDEQLSFLCGFAVPAPAEAS